MKNLRKISLNVLSTKLGEESAKKYETAIYNMVVKISQRDGDVENTYRKIAFDKIGQIMVSNGPIRNKILNDLKNAVEDWDSYIYLNQRLEYNREIDRSVQKLQSVKGVYVCNYKGCKSDEFYIWSVQTKGGDEGMTNYRQCAICNKRKKDG
jgi:DNA-directed RNA polymerase subunit M/transcription elongation factor TFIIS